MSCDLKNEVCGFRCTGYEGQEIWEEIHALPKKISCESCSDHATELFKGLHDHVNAGLGKTIYDYPNYSKFVAEVNCTFAKCQEKGLCK